MSDDLIDRLRNVVDEGADPDLIYEAADEVERLRAIASALGLEDHSHRAVSVKIQRRQIGEREVDQIRVCISDLHLSCDVSSDRAIRQAKRLADSHQAHFMYDEHNAERVRRALGIAPGDAVAAQVKEQ